ncbi:MAG: hypothetical protein JWQ69_4825 [Pseudomonas sp.]|nr:hypothetical protein [Pseudomonas sp.]
MAETHFKIIFEGRLRNGVELETAKLNLAGLFKSEASVVEKLFSGQPVILKRGLSQEQAQRYLSALHQAGVEAQVETEHPTVNLSLDEVEPPKSYQAPIEPSSPYAPPQAAVGASLPEFSELKVFTVQGRIGRLRYLAWSLVLMLAILVVATLCALLLTNSLVAGGLIITVAVVAFAIVSVQIGVQRLHDAGWSGWLLLINLVPFVGSLFPLLLMIIPGNAGVNQYGPPQPPNGKAVKILASMWVLVIAISSLGLYVGGVNMFENEVQSTASEYENTLPQDDDNDSDASQPGDAASPSVDYKHEKDE